MEHKSVGSRRWAYLALCAFGLLFDGIIYAWSILKVPLLSHYAWSETQLALGYTLSMCFFCLGSLAIGTIGKRLSVKTVLLLSGGFILGGLMATAYLPLSSVVMLYLFYSVVVGLGVGASNTMLLTVGTKWFPDKKGVCSGLLMMSFGLSTTILGHIMSDLFDRPGVGWQQAYALLGAAIALVMLICAFTLKMPTEQDQFPVPKPTPAQIKNTARNEYSTKQMLKRRTFWVYYIHGIFAASVGSVVISFSREFTMSMGATAALATTVVGLLAVCNSLGRILCGLSVDILATRKTMMFSSVITLLAPVIMIAAILTHSLGAAIAAICLAGISYGCAPTISSAFVMSFYGTVHFSENYSVSNTKLLFSSCFATIASYLIAANSYLPVFIMLTVLAGISAVLCFTIRRP